jgi:hypothetical protein
MSLRPFNPFPIVLALLVAANLLVYCVQPPDYPDEPVIEFTALSKNVMRQTTFGTDSVVISFDFTDGDGDLGFQDTSASIFIVDGRDSFSKPSYRIPYVEQQGTGNGISGTISIVLPTTCCIYPLSSGIPPCDTSNNAPQAFDTVFYLISIKDRAGHVSNQITTAPITLVCKQ